MPDLKNVKNFLFGIAALCLIAGQYLMLFAGQMAGGLALTLLAALLFFAAFAGWHVALVNGIIAMMEAIKKTNEQKPALPQPKPAAKSASAAKAVKAPKKGEPAASAPAETMPAQGGGIYSRLSQWFSHTKLNGVTIVIPRLFMYAVAGIVFLAAQYLMMTGALSAAILLLVLDAALFVLAYTMKTGSYSFTFRIDSTVRVVVILAGLASVAFGWILLLNQNVNTQQVGVVFTVIGCIAAFLGLPQSDDKTHPGYVDRPILFEKPEWMNTWAFKTGAVLAMFVLLKVGSAVLQSPDYNLTAIYIYAAAILCGFLALPLVNLPESRTPNKLLDILALGAIVLAALLAYKGQTEFTKQNIVPAVRLFIAAAILFIAAMPVFKSGETEDKSGIPVQAEVLFLLIIMAAGIFLRVYELDVRPLGIENDEAGGATARMSKTGAITLPTSVGNYGIPFHIMRLFIAMFGELDRFTMKLMAVSMGVISIPAVYFMIRTMLGARAAMFGGAVYVFMRWAIHYGRFGHTTIWTVLSEVFAVYFIFRAIKSRRKLDWFLGGMALTMTWHSVMTAFLIVVPIGFYFIVKALSDRNYIKFNAVGLAAFFLGTWIFASMTLHNYFLSSKIYFSRVQEVSVFSKDPNAPSKNVGKGIVENAKRVMLMFNHQGDSRQRNSGGAPLEPTIDFTSAIFFAIGLLYALYYSKHYMFLIMCAIFLSQACGSIFSIEAPSAMRAVGTMVPVVFFIALAFDLVWTAMRRVFGKKYELLYLLPLLVLPMIPIAKANWDSYFTKWTGGMDELSTAAGMYSRELGDKTRIVLYTGLYYPGHPPFKMYRWDYKVNSANRLTTLLVWMRLIEDEDFAILFHYDTWNNFNAIKDTYFPDAKAELIDHNHFNKKVKPGEGIGLFFKSIVVPNEQIQKIRGLRGRYSYNPAVVNNDLPVFRKEDAAKAPYNASWEGALLVPYYGKFRIANKTQVPVDVTVDGKKTNNSTYLVLSEGFHNIRISARRSQAADSLDMFMECRELDGKTVRRVEQVKLDGKYLYNWKVRGLHTYYYTGNKWDKNPVLCEINNTEADFSGGTPSDCVAWKGYINIDRDGYYSFSGSTNGYARVVVDGRNYWDIRGNQAKETEAKEYFDASKPMLPGGNLRLTPGRHRFEVYMLGASMLALRWSTPAGGEPGPIPPGLFEPDGAISPE